MNFAISLNKKSRRIGIRRLGFYFAAQISFPNFRDFLFSENGVCVGIVKKFLSCEITVFNAQFKTLGLIIFNR